MMSEREAQIKAQMTIDGMRVRIDDYERRIGCFLSEITEHLATISERDQQLGVERDRNTINESMAKEVVQINKDTKLQIQKLRKELADLNNELVRRRCSHVYESDCRDVEVIKDPDGGECTVGGTDTRARWTHDPWCGGSIPNEDKS